MVVEQLKYLQSKIRRYINAKLCNYGKTTSAYLPIFFWNAMPPNTQALNQGFLLLPLNPIIPLN